MDKSPLQIEDLKMRKIRKGTHLLCFLCGLPIVTKEEFLLADDGNIICDPCADEMESNQ